MRDALRHIIPALLLAVAFAPVAGAQWVYDGVDDDEPIDMELVRLPVRRPPYAVLTVVTVRDEADAARYASVAVPEDNAARVSEAVRRANALAVSRGGSRTQSAAEVEASVERYLSEARGKAPAYKPVVIKAVRVPAEERMSRQELLRSFVCEHTVGRDSYRPKGAPERLEANSIYMHFDVPTGARPAAMCLRVQYYADDPLLTQSLEFTIGGRKLTLTPAEVHSQRRGRFVTEWFDMPLTGDDVQLQEAMGHANYVRVKFVGKTCSHIKDLTREQVADLRRAYYLHKLIR